ncbi:tRNA dihydrouridine(20/20a) synthase DusA [Roseateles koreensis]|uniref:tRNA-dihydrouridine(20/20a) synthase n=1 Tax=Roseateles koreensis TaxID=2987526 RepID=A0ABT5KQN0_9BURK|nr:tRNA dihydrouridine(20/20a) synthase DusA [Roseateles koreensis]MDC8785220.1 tRNA dihydrouridine(20/20a) synthase DusA [Roseateles koreensis]
MTNSLDKSTPYNPWRLSVAPMLDWTDRHCRVFHRLLTRHTRLYTEMVTTGALLHGDQPRHLDFNEIEHPVALQLGGSEPADLAACAKLAEKWGYDEVNLNCGCPSERVQRGAFGACLMAEPALVAQGMKAMKDAVSIPVTIKHRIGVDRVESYDFVRDFVGQIAEAGCEVFIVHARNAWLQGISPKENRELPPLRYEIVHQLKREFPHLTIVLNGGIKADAEIAEQLQHVDGVMVGRQAYHEPWQMAAWDETFFAEAGPALSREQVEAAWLDYLQAQVAASGRSWSQGMRHALGLWNGQAGSRRWRQIWSDHQYKSMPVAEVAAVATQARTGVAAQVQAHEEQFQQRLA